MSFVREDSEVHYSGVNHAMTIAPASWNDQVTAGGWGCIAPQDYPFRDWVRDPATGDWGTKQYRRKCDGTREYPPHRSLTVPRDAKARRIRSGGPSPVRGGRPRSHAETQRTQRTAEQTIPHQFSAALRLPLRLCVEKDDADPGACIC